MNASGASHGYAATVPPTSDAAGWLPTHRRSAGVARLWLRKFLSDADGGEPYFETGELLLGELVANAVGHARAPRGRQIQVRFALASALLRLEVHDAGEGRPAVRTAGADDESGRGLWLVERLSERWGHCPRSGGPGKVVWCEVAPTSRQLEDPARQLHSNGPVTEAFSAAAPVIVEIEDVTAPVVFGRLPDALAATWEALRVLPLGAVQADAFHYFLTRPDAATDIINVLRREGELSLTFRMGGRLHSVRVHPAETAGRHRGR